MAQPEPTSTQVLLQNLVTPLLEQHESLLAEIAQLQTLVADRRKELVDIDRVLRRLAPDSVPTGPRQPKPEGQHGQSANHDQYRAATVALLNNGRLEDGFTATQLKRTLRSEGVTGVTVAALRPVLEELLGTGDIRFVKVTQGGGKLFQPVPA